MHRHPLSTLRSRAAHQRGAVLYVALIMLILLALIGIVGMQVAGIQERMAASYRAVNLAFQGAEELVRNAECGLELLNDVPDVAETDCTEVSRGDIEVKCDDGFDAGTWVAGRTLAGGGVRNIRQIETCIIGEAEIDMGGPRNERDVLPVYQITTYQTDTGGTNGTSASAVETIFKL